MKTRAMYNVEELDFGPEEILDNLREFQFLRQKGLDGWILCHTREYSTQVEGQPRTYGLIYYFYRTEVIE